MQRVAALSSPGRLGEWVVGAKRKLETKVGGLVNQGAPSGTGAEGKGDKKPRDDEMA